MAKPKSVALSDFSRDFLDRYELYDFSLSFDPVRRVNGQRAKRGTTSILARDPKSAPDLGPTRTVGDLFQKLFELAPEVREWSEAKRERRVPRLRYGNERVDETETLLDLRHRSATLLDQARQKARKTLNRALKECSGLLDDDELLAVLSEITEERRYAARG